MNISHATIEDVTALNALVNSAYRGESSKQGWTTEADLLAGQRCDEEMLRDMISDSNSFMLKVTDDEEKIISCVYLRKDKKRLYLGMLTVSPTLQNHGIGKKLLRACEDEAKRLGVESIYMTVITVRTELIDWYIRHGYSKTNERQPFKSGDPRYGIPKQKLEFIVLEKNLYKS